MAEHGSDDDNAPPTPADNPVVFWSKGFPKSGFLDPRSWGDGSEKTREAMEVLAKAAGKLVLGNGSYGVVYKSIERPKDIVHKATTWFSAPNETILWGERETCPNVLCLQNISFYEAFPHLAILTFERLHPFVSTQNVSPNAVLEYVRDCHNAIEYLDNRGLVHMDLSLANIMFRNGPTRHIAVLSDLGSLLPQSTQPNAKPIIYLGPVTTWPYRAPEHYNLRHITVERSCSLYSLAVVACSWLQLGAEAPGYVARFGKYGEGSEGAVSTALMKEMTQTGHCHNVWLTDAKWTELGDHVLAKVLRNWLDLTPSKRQLLHTLMGDPAPTPIARRERHYRPPLQILRRALALRKVPIILTSDHVAAVLLMLHEIERRRGTQHALLYLELGVRLFMLLAQTETTADHVLFHQAMSMADRILVDNNDAFTMLFSPKVLPTIIADVWPYRFELVGRMPNLDLAEKFIVDLFLHFR